MREPVSSVHHDLAQEHPPHVALLPAVAECALFSGVPEEQLLVLLQRAELRDVPAGEMLYEQGARGRSLFIVLAGEVRLTRCDDSDSEVELGQLRKADWCGEMAMLDMMPRACCARAVSDTQILQLCASDLDALYRTSTKVYALLLMNLARQLSRKLRQKQQLICRLSCADGSIESEAAASEQ